MRLPRTLALLGCCVLGACASDRQSIFQPRNAAHDRDRAAYSRSDRGDPWADSSIYGYPAGPEEFDGSTMARERHLRRELTRLEHEAALERQAMRRGQGNSLDRRDRYQQLQREIARLERELDRMNALGPDPRRERYGFNEPRFSDSYRYPAPDHARDYYRRRF